MQEKPPSQKTLEGLFSDRNEQVRQDIGSRKSAEDQIAVLKEELKASKTLLSSFEKKMEERIRFDVLLSEISTHFINLPSDQIDSAIEAAQRRICNLLGLDLSALWQLEAGNLDEFVLTHLYRAIEDPPIPGRMAASEQVPWFFQQAMTGKIIVISSLDEVPAEAARDLEIWNYFGVKTTLNLPLVTGNDPPFGVLSFNDIKSEQRNWSETLIKRLQLVAQMFANALARKFTDQRLLTSEQRLSLATDAAGAGLWIFDLPAGKFWVSEKAKDLYGFSLEEEMDYDGFLKKVHPEDRENVDLSFQKVLQADERVQIDYRYIFNDGCVRWITSRGSRQRNLTDETYSIMGVSTDITQRKQMENELRENLYFESLIADISTHFINLPPKKVDSGIQQAQRRVCECLRLDASSLWQLSVHDPNSLIMTHLYRAVEGPPVPEKMDANEFFPWSKKEVMCGRTVAVSSMDNLPPEAAEDLKAWRQFGIKTSLGIPLITGNGPPLGLISFNDMKSERTWPESLVRRLELVGQMFAGALARKRSDEFLRESEWRLSMATEAAGAGLWVMDMATEKVWVSDKLRELYHFLPDENISYPRFFETIHPEDCDQVNQMVQQAIRSGESLHSDYRILLPDGSQRWVCARGGLHLKQDGKPGQLMGVTVDITDRVMMENKLIDQIQEIAALKQRLENENLYLQKEIKFLVEHLNIVGRSLAVKRILREAEQVAATDSTVLILGETGTGKEILARAIHRMSGRKDRPMITINCASLPPTLIESELFGREKGAYTGAMTKMAGRFEIADGSTLFLDEIGELPMEIQIKLLRVLEEGVFERLGSTKSVRVNTRIIAATNRDIENEVAEGRFRKDLFFRLNVFPIVVPPLRERSEDIPLLVWAFVKEFQKRMGKEIETVSKKTMESLQSYVWPGNIRELRNVIEHSMILSNNSTLTVHLPKSRLQKKDETHHLDDIERQHITSILKQTGWRVGAAAGILGMKRSTLYSRMKKLGINRPSF